MEAEAKILRCKRHLEQDERPPPEKLHKILDRLEKAEVDIDLLKSTEIGKAVNNLRRDPHVGRRAKELVAKWKDCVNVAVTGDESSNGVGHNPPPPVPAPPPEPPRPPPPPTDHLDSSLPMDMEISPGDSQEDDDDDDGDVNMDHFISAETMERGEAAIRSERESCRRTEEDEDEVIQPSLDERLKDVLGGSPTRSTEDDNMDGFDVDFAAVFQLANTKKEDRFKLSEGARGDKGGKDKSKPKPPDSADRSKEKEQLLASLNSSIKRYEKRVSESKGTSSSTSSSSKTKEELKKRAKEKEKRERERKEKERRKEGKEERERRKERTEGWLKDGIPAVPLPHLDQGDAPKQLHNEQKHRHRDGQTHHPKTKDGQHHHKAKDGHHHQHSKSNGAPEIPKTDISNNSKPDKHHHRREEKEKERQHHLHRTTSSDTNLIPVTDTNSNDVVKADRHVAKHEKESKADKHSKHESDSTKADKQSKHHHEASAAKFDYKANHSSDLSKRADAKHEKRSDPKPDHKSELKKSEHHKKHRKSENPPPVPSKRDNEDSSNSEPSKHKHRKTEEVVLKHHNNKTSSNSEDASSSNSKESKSSKKSMDHSKPSSTPSSTSSSKQSSTSSLKPAAAPAATGGFSFDDLMNYDDPVKRKKMAKKLQKVEVIGFVEKGEKKLKNEIENGEKQKSGEDSSDFPSKSGLVGKDVVVGKSAALASMPARSAATTENSESFKPPKPVPIPIKIDRDDLDDMLPAIAPEYKPMSKLYNDIEAKSKSGPRVDAEEDATAVFSKKSIGAGRMIYSGRKKPGLTKMTSLFDMCMTILGNHIEDLEEVGGIPATLLMPILKKCSDEQLYRLEEYNPHFLEDTEVLWKGHCEKKFPRSKPDEDGMETWRELYDNKIREQNEKMKMLTASISMKQRMSTTNMRKTQLAYVDVASAKPPRAVRIAQQKYGTAGKSAPSNSSSKKGSSSSSSTSGGGGGVDDAAAAAAREENARLRMASMASITADDVDKPVRGLGGKAIQRGGDGGEKRVKIAAPMMMKSMKMMKNRFNSALPFAKR